MTQLTSTEAKALLSSDQPMTPAQYIALISFLASVGLAFVLEDQSMGSLDRDAIFDRAEQLYANNQTTLAAHIAEYRAAQESTD